MSVGQLPQRDFAELLVGFARTLRHAGVPAGPDRVQAMLGALAHLDVLDPEPGLLGRPVDAVRRSAGPGPLRRGVRAVLRRPRGRPPARHQQPAPGTAGRPVRGRRLTLPASPAEDQPSFAAQASRQEILRHKDVSALSPAERDELRRLFALLAPRVAHRRSQRHGPANRGRVDLARTVRGMLRTGAEPGRLAYRRRRTKPRRLVLLIDVSGSMAPYADTLLRFAHAAVRAAPASTEVFSTGTRLTRVTRELRLRDPDQALAAAGRAVPDWSGGTRLGDGVKAFLDLWGQRGLARGAVLVLCSDGWERGDPAELDAQLGRLARLAHALIWVNPHKGRPGFEPVTGGMQAAVTHADALVAGHSFAALEQLVEVISHA